MEDRTNQWNKKNFKNDVEVIKETIQVTFNKIFEKKQKRKVKPWKIKHCTKNEVFH